jgi:acetyltransferase-like isoleucine patch superfamily enzyme
MGWRDMTLTPAVEIGIFLASGLCTFALHRRYNLSLFADVVLFYAWVIAWTLVVLKLLRVLFPFREGTYSYARHPWETYVWNLQAFFCITNLSLFYENALLPPPFRKVFYQLLGARIGKGIISIGGRLSDPYLVTIEENVIIGEEALLIPHAVAMDATGDILILGKIEVKQGAVIGARTTIMPGVIIGERSMVKAMSLVTMNTQIPPNEVWAGIPARKVGTLDPS